MFLVPSQGARIPGQAGLAETFLAVGFMKISIKRGRKTQPAP